MRVSHPEGRCRVTQQNLQAVSGCSRGEQSGALTLGLTIWFEVFALLRRLSACGLTSICLGG